MMKRTLLAAALAAFVATPAFAAECPKLMKSYDDAAAKNASKVTAEAKKLRADGEDDHKAGKHTESMTALKKAGAIVGAM